MKEKNKVIVSVIVVIIIATIVGVVFSMKQKQEIDNNINTNVSHQNELDMIEPQDPEEENPTNNIPTPTKEQRDVVTNSIPTR